MRKRTSRHKGATVCRRSDVREASQRSWGPYHVAVTSQGHYHPLDADAFVRLCLLFVVYAKSSALFGR